MSSFVRTISLPGGRRLRARVEQHGDRWIVDTGEGGAREASVFEVEPGVFSIVIDGHVHEIRSTGMADIEVEDPRAPRKSASHAGLDGPQRVVAPMPGKVVRVLVKSGDTVERGQGLIVIEAMKMQNEMKSPKQGVVVSIAALESATVAAGDVLATVE